MNQDVDKLQESIDSLVRSMGLEPTDQQHQQVLPSTSLGLGNGVTDADADGFDLGEMGGDGFDHNFDVDQFLTELAQSEKQIQEDQKPLL